MILIRLMGGLGNQMFQYAFGKRMALANNTELVLDQSLLLDKTQPHEITTHRDFDLDIFKDLKFRWATPSEVFAFNGESKASIFKKVIRKLFNIVKPRKLVIQEKNLFLEQYLNYTGDTCFVGRWQSYKFFESFKEDIIKEFSLHKPQIEDIDEVIAKIIASENPICLHVRRGDLVSSPLYNKTIGALPLAYFNQSVSFIKQKVNNPSFFIFSDDIDWCISNLNLDENVFFVDNKFSGKKADGHLYLMMKCKHFIISNSTYAWWAAYLSNSPQKLVIYPQKWYKDSSLKNIDLCPGDWLKK